MNEHLIAAQECPNQLLLHNRTFVQVNYLPDSKVHGVNMGPAWVLSASGGPHVGKSPC